MLRERIAVLERELCPPFLAPREWRLTQQQERLMSVLLAREVATKGSVMAALYRDLGREEGALKTLDVIVYQVRCKLRPHGICINTRWNVGWYLEADVRHRLRKSLLRSGDAR